MPTARVMGVYRKSHIPTGPGYQEKYYFTPGDTGFRVWHTRFGVLGVGICWDQWFPETARAMALMGAEALLFPTAIGSEPPPAPPLDSRDHWRRVMQGHAAANCMPLVASNRIGVEKGQAGEMTFYGSSFIADRPGDLAAELGRSDEGFVGASSISMTFKDARVMGTVPRSQTRSLQRANEPRWTLIRAQYANS